MVHEMKNCELSMFQVCKQRLRRKLLGLYVPVLILAYGFSAPFFPVSSMEEFEKSNQYSVATQRMTHPLHRQGDLADFALSPKTRKIVCATVKTVFTILIDRQFDEMFPTRDENEEILWWNLARRIFCKGTTHCSLNIIFKALETGVSPTQKQVNGMLYKTVLDVMVSECTSNFVPEKDKEIVKTLLQGMINLAT